MSVTSDLVDFAKDAGAQVHVYNGDGIAVTWDCGRNWQHMWDRRGARPQAFYGESEYAEARIPMMISDYGEMMLKWAIVRIGGMARSYKGWPGVNIPRDASSVEAQWGFQQLTPITGRLTLEELSMPMEMRTIFPYHYELNEYSHVAQMDFDDLLAAYQDPTGGELLSRWVR